MEQIRVDLDSDPSGSLHRSFSKSHKVRVAHATKTSYHATKTLAITDLEEIFEKILHLDLPLERAAFDLALEGALAMNAHEDGMVDFEQLKLVLQRTKEIGRRMHHDQRLEAAVCKGFREDELEDLHKTFVSLDIDGSGTIDIDEAWTAVSALNHHMSRPLFTQIYNKVDKDGSSSLEFDEFLELLHMYSGQ